MSELGKRKVGLVKWLMKQGVPLEKAKLIAHYKYYHHTRVRNKWSFIPEQHFDKLQFNTKDKIKKTNELQNNKKVE